MGCPDARRQGLVCRERRTLAEVVEAAVDVFDLVAVGHRLAAGEIEGARTLRAQR
jgi:hypothetical protein